MYKLENKTVKGLSPLTINRTAENKMRVYPYGYTEQATRDGINQLMSFEEAERDYFVDITNRSNSDTDYWKAEPLADNWIHMECDCTTATSTQRYINTYIGPEQLPNLKAGTQYTIVIEFRNVNITTMTGNLNFGRTSGTGNDNFFNGIFTFTPTVISGSTMRKNILNTMATMSGSYALRNFHTVNQGDKFSYDYRISVLEGDYRNVDYVYEPFGVMPSPEFPSDIKNLGDNIQLLDIDNASQGYYFSTNGELTEGVEGWLYVFIKAKSNTTYTFSGVTTTNNTIGIAQFNSNKEFVKYGISYKNGSFTTENTTEYLGVSIRQTEANVVKLEKGTTATPYTPYGCGSVDLKVENKNKCKLEISVQASATATINNDKITMKPIVTTGVSYIVLSYREFEIGKKYTVSFKTEGNYRMAGLFSGPYTLDKSWTTTNYSFTLQEGDNTKLALGFYVNVGSLDNEAIIYDIQIEEGNKTDYVEHQEQIVTFPLTERQLLHKGDYLAEDGIHQVRKTIVLDGTKTLGLMSSSDTGRNLIYYSAELSDIKKDFTSLKNCSHFEATKRAIENWENYNYESCSTNANNTIYFNTSMTLAELKTFLAEQYANGTPVTIEYELEEEIVIPYTEEQEYVLNHIYSYEETTNINIISEFETEIDVEYTPQFLQEIKDKFIKGPTFGRIHITDTNEDFTQDNYLKDFSVSELRFVPDKGLFGGCVAKKVDVNFNNVNKQFSIQDKEFEAYLGVDYEDERYEIKYGTFIVQHPETEDTTDNTSFTALDYMIKFNQKYIDYVTYPCTLRDIAESICIQAGVTLSEEKFRNDDFIVENNQFVNGENLRQVLQGIALSAFSWARVDENNELHFDLNQKEDIDIELTPNEYYNLSKDDYIYGPVNRIIIRDSQIEGENVTIDDEELQRYALGKNKFDKDNAKILNAYLHQSQTTILTSSSDRVIYIPCKKNTTYTITKGLQTTTTLNRFKIATANELPAIGVKIYNFVNGGTDGTTTTELTITTDSNSKYLIAFIYASDSAMTLEELLETIQIEEGTEATEYEPFIPSGICELVIEDNPFAYTQEKREQLIEAAKELFGFRYMPINEVSLIGLAFLNSKDKIRFNTLDGDVFDTYLFDHTINYNGVILDNMQSKALTKTETKYIYKPDITQAIKNTQIIVDKANQTINQIIEKQDEQSSQLVNIETDLSGVHTTIQDNQKDIEEKINEIEQTIEGTKQTLTYKGGNNIFYYAKEFWNNGTEGGTANLEELTSDTEIQQKSVSGNAYIINKGTSEQKNIVKNDTYTISFTYKKLIDLATGYVDINGTIIDLTSTSWKEEVETIEIDTNTIDIKIVSDTANAFKIFDLMGAVGNEKQVWTQNPNETRTDTVTIGKGIQVNSSSKNTYTRLDADGTRIYNSDTGLPVTEFTQQGVDTDKITADVGQVGGILIQVIDGQTWFSSLL